MAQQSQQELQAELAHLLATQHLTGPPCPEFLGAERAQVVRQLYKTILNQPEWVAAFLPDPADDSDFSAQASASGARSTFIPSWDDASEWLLPYTDTTYEPQRCWSLLDAQRLNEERHRRAGKPGRVSRPGSICGKVLQRYDRTYICKTCAKDSSCVLCVDCFQASNHEGHEVLFGLSYTFAAVCDCGDSSAWQDNEHLGCAHHPPVRGNQLPRPKAQNPPSALCKALYETIVICVEYIIAAFERSALPNDYGKLPATREEMAEGNIPSAEPAELRGKGPWAIVAWADERHGLREVTRQFRDATGLLWDVAERDAKEWDEVGRKVLAVVQVDTQAFHHASMLQQIDIGVTLHHAYDVYREDVAGFLIQWLSEMCKTTICGDDELVRRYVAMAFFQPRNRRSKPDVGSPLAPDLADLEASGSKAVRFDWLMRLDVRLWKRAKWQLRDIYAGIFVLGRDFKRQLATRYSINYGFTFEHYLYQDRDDSSLAFSMSYMLLGRSSPCGEAIVESQLFRSVLETAFNYYSLRGTKDEWNEYDVQRFDIDSPAFKGKKGLTLLSHLRALLKYKEVKAQIVQDEELFERTLLFLNHFVGLQSQRRELERHVEYEVDWIKSVSVLPDLSKLAREFGEAFYLADINQILTAITMVQRRIVEDQTLQSTTLDRAMYESPTVKRVEDVFRPGTAYSILDINVARITAFSIHHYMHLVMAELVKAYRHVCFPDPTNCSPARFANAFITVAWGSPPAPWTVPTYLMEFPLQKHVVLSQIRLSMWMKNGAAMRHQYHNYREPAHREFTIDQEFFLLQFALCIMDQQHFLTVVIERHGLSDFFRLNVMSPKLWEGDMDPKEAVAMMEELLLLIIYLVSDTAVINRLDSRDITRKHIIQTLALGPLPYSEVVRKLPERSHERGSLIPILDELATFRPPTETATGSYTLKPEFFAEVDPFWRQYSRNEQRDAAQVLLDRALKEDPSETNPVIKPLPLRIPPHPAPFCNLADFLQTPTASAIVYWSLSHCMIMATPEDWPGKYTSQRQPTGHVLPAMDALLTLSLHLAMMVLDADPGGFAMRSLEIIETSGSMSIFQNLWFMQTNSAFKVFRPKVDYILERIVENLPENYTVDYRAQRDSRRAAAAQNAAAQQADSARAQAKARQQALKAKFAQQQANFAATFMDDLDDEEEEQEQNDRYGECIVCQEPVHPGRTGGMLAFLQPSRIIRDAVTDRDWYEEVLQTPSDLDRDTRYLRFGMATTGEPLNTDAYPSTNMRFGVYVSACGHLMHDHCIYQHNEGTRTRQASQVQRHQPENAMRHEYMCPLCKSIGNILVPLDPTATSLRPMPRSKVAPGLPPTLSERIRAVSEEGLLRVSDSAKIWDFHVETGELVPWFTDCEFQRHALDATYRKTHKNVHRMVDRIRQLTRPLSEQSQRIRGKKTHMYLADDLVGYTVSVCEITHRGMATPGLTVAEQIPETGLKLIKHLIGTLQLELDLFFGTKTDRTPLRVGLFARFLPDWYRSATLPSPLLFRLPLGMVVEAAAIAPDLLQAVIVMSYYAELTRTMLGLSVFIRRSVSSRSAPQPRTEPPPDVSREDALSVFGNFRQLMISVLRNAGPFIDIEAVLALIPDETVARLLYAFTLPFLRRSAIIYYAVNNAYPVTNPDYIVTEGCEYRRLLSLLGIPSPTETLGNPHSTETPIVARWLTQWAMQGRIIPPLEYPGTYELMRLPEAYEVAAIRYAGERCDVCGMRPSYPALCLICGRMVCLAGDCCSEGEQGECNLHMRECGGVVGIFADLKRWVILYLFAGSGSFGPMPYLDQFGELETNLR
ncbi:ubiquitin-protein ligase [Cutaneotrichosporon oleaginosum]|uniref:E3 ubiquitin-protein ligase n=1 Tax=Cutaneotrichosporon oleaginosum TaxID=879819 RepID=A0A0J0XD69_9TREE|nr:ubiquitin-protein ligase [Cutaneotrichosporon oleaginosum]KLT39021.1 ubiquitin-protein ligase [Cutaneotrichosporon oleaginosum]TXT03968.1 hypothetical protein COLE_07665 [Cutaneotrichosporon oleaginosum]